MMYHRHVIGRRMFCDEWVRRAHVRLARDAAARSGYTGRIQFSGYSITAPGLGRGAVEIRVYT